MKKLRYIPWLFALAILVMIVAGCGSGAKVVTTVPSKDQQPKQIINRYAYAYYMSGVLAEKEQQFPTAIKSYEEALKHSPGNSEILYTLAELHYNLRQFQVALETANQIVYKDKRAYTLIGNCHRVFGNDAEAEHARPRAPGRHLRGGCFFVVLRSGRGCHRDCHPTRRRARDHG